MINITNFFYLLKKELHTSTFFITDNTVCFFCNGNRIYIKLSEQELTYIPLNIVKIPEHKPHFEKTKEIKINFEDGIKVLKNWFNLNTIPQNTDIYIYKNFLYVLNGSFILKSELNDSIGERSVKLPNILINVLIEENRLLGCWKNDSLILEFNNIVMESGFMQQNIFCDRIDNFISTLMLDLKKGIFTGKELELTENKKRFYVNGLSTILNGNKYSYSEKLVHTKYLTNDIYFYLF